MLTPFQNNGHLNIDETFFNMAHSSTTVIVEKSFERLKTKFRCLHYLHIFCFPLVSKFIYVSCVFHNFIIDHEIVVNNVSPEQLSINKFILLILFRNVKYFGDMIFVRFVHYCSLYYYLSEKQVKE